MLSQKSHRMHLRKLIRDSVPKVSPRSCYIVTVLLTCTKIQVVLISVYTNRKEQVCAYKSTSLTLPLPLAERTNLSTSSDFLYSAISGDSSRKPVKDDAPASYSYLGKKSFSLCFYNLHEHEVKVRAYS